MSLIKTDREREGERERERDRDRERERERERKRKRNKGKKSILYTHEKEDILMRMKSSTQEWRDKTVYISFTSQ